MWETQNRGLLAFAELGAETLRAPGEFSAIRDHLLLRLTAFTGVVHVNRQRHIHALSLLQETFSLRDLEKSKTFSLGLEMRWEGWSPLSPNKTTDPCQHLTKKNFNPRAELKEFC